MKKFFFLMMLSFMLASFSPSNSDDIINALKQGNIEQFTQYFDTLLDVKLPDKDEMKNAGKNQASLTLKSFFNENTIKGFDVTSQRELGGTMYLTGKLQGASKNYNLTLMIKAKGDKAVIITIRIN